MWGFSPDVSIDHGIFPSNILVQFGCSVGAAVVIGVAWYRCSRTPTKGRPSFGVGFEATSIQAAVWCILVSIPPVVFYEIFHALDWPSNVVVASDLYGFPLFSVLLLVISVASLSLEALQPVMRWRIVSRFFLAATDRILVMPASLGLFVTPVADTVVNGSVIASDVFNSAMVPHTREQLQANLRCENTYNAAVLEIGNYCALPFDTGTFDVVVCPELCHMPLISEDDGHIMRRAKIGSVLRETGRVLVNGGKLYVVESFGQARYIQRLMLEAGFAHAYVLRNIFALSLVPSCVVVGIVGSQPPATRFVASVDAFAASARSEAGGSHDTHAVLRVFVLGVLTLVYAGCMVAYGYLFKHIPVFPVGIPGNYQAAWGVYFALWPVPLLIYLHYRKLYSITFTQPLRSGRVCGMACMDAFMRLLAAPLFGAVLFIPIAVLHWYLHTDLSSSTIVALESVVSLIIWALGILTIQVAIPAMLRSRQDKVLSGESRPLLSGAPGSSQRLLAME